MTKLVGKRNPNHNPLLGTKVLFFYNFDIQSLVNFPQKLVKLVEFTLEKKIPKSLKFSFVKK
jgi:hypothetical protein